MQFKDFSDFQTYLDHLGLFRMKLGLSRITQALDRLGLDDAPFPIAHVLGTNGKGSTARFLAAVAEEHGLKTGLYISPHFLTLRERIRINSRMLPEETWLDLAERVYRACHDLDVSYFEFLTAMAVLVYREERVDLAVLEAGLGGMHDAVSALTPKIAVITPIALDHTAILGNTIEQIAADKAGAIKPGVPVVCARQVPEAAEVLTRKAGKAGTRLDFASKVVDFDPLKGKARFLNAPGGLEISGITLAAPGKYQVQNARLALAAWHVLAPTLGVETNPEACKRALAATTVPGRMQMVPGRPCFLLDGAHNPAGMNVLKAALDETGVEPVGVIFSCMADKDVAGMAGIAASLTQGPVVVAGLGDYARAADPKDLARLVGGRARAALELRQAVDYFNGLDGTVVVCGSLYLVSEFFKLRPDALGTRA